jgi:4-hydroxy-tetrahydrodipicolinate synthase
VSHHLERTTSTFGGVFTVLPTAFGDDGRLDLAGLVALVDANRRAGVSGFVALGVMGEAAELTEPERRKVVETIKGRSGELPVVVGISAERTPEIARRAADAAALGATALMVSPARSVPLAEAVGSAGEVGLPIVIQDYPAGSGAVVSVEDIAAAWGASELVAVKVEAPPTAGKIASIRERLPHLPTFGGLGGLFLIDELRAGAAGTMTGFALPECLVEIVREFATAPEAADVAWQRLLPLMRFEAFPPLNLATRKEVWRLRGVIGSAYCRRDGATLDDRTRADVRRAYELVVSSNRA